MYAQTAIQNLPATAQTHVRTQEEEVATAPATLNLPATTQTRARAHGQETAAIIETAIIRTAIIRTGIIRAAMESTADKNGVLTCAMSRR